MTTITADITNNTITYLDRMWFSIRDWSTVRIVHNKFGDLHQLFIGPTANPVDCTFGQNYINVARPDSLNFNSTHCKIREVRFLHECVCTARGKISWLQNLTTIDIRDEAYCSITDELRGCYNTSLLNVRKLETDVCDASKKELNCLQSQANNKKIEANFLDPKDFADRRLNVNVIYVILASSILLILITIVLCLVIRKMIKKRTIIIPVAEMSSGPGVIGGGDDHRMMKSPSQTFSNDDRNIINNTLNCVKMKNSRYLYDQLYGHTQRLLEANLPDDVAVTTISNILENLKKCKDPGTDLVAFTAILNRLLGPTTEAMNGGEHVYAEPHLLGVAHQYNGQHHNQQQHQTTALEPIYAEPQSVQQPLLTNEYSLPADKNEVSNLYTEIMQNPIGKNC